MNKLMLLQLCIILFSCNTNQRENINTDYFPDTEWNKKVDQLGLGQVVGLDVDANQNILVFHRAGREWSLRFPKAYIEDNTVAFIDAKTGAIKKSWGKNLFIMPHGLTVDDNNHIWLTDIGRHQVFKFNQDGELLLVLGEENVPGKDSLHFDQPTDIAISSMDSSVYISDGYGNSRVAKFNYNGQFLFDFGTKGEKTGQFNLPHAIEIDPNEIIYVADRENHRIQSFDVHGSFLSVWENKSFGQIHSIAFNSKENILVAIDYKSILEIFPIGSDVLLFENDGNPPSKFGRSGNYEGEALRYHDLAIDKNGNIYLGDILQNKLIRYIKKGNGG